MEFKTNLCHFETSLENIQKLNKVWEMAQLVECLLCKDENLSLILRTHIKQLGSVVDTCNP